MQEPLRLEQKETILRSAEAVLDEAIAFLQGMIHIPTVNPPGEAYPACARYIGEQLHSLGYTVEYINLTPAEIAELAPYGAGLPRTNVIGRLPGANASPVLHFNGHMDVVPIGPGWSTSPFGGEVRDRRIFGRGASDMKGGIAAQVYESTGNRNAGMGLLVERGFIAPSHTDYVVITEPLNADNICLGHRGAIWGEITTFGHQAHGSTPERGVNAIELMADFITEVRHELKPRLQQRLSSLPIVPSSANAASLSFNTIQGGTNVNSVPDRCSVTFDRRLVMGERLEEARSELCNLLEQRARTQPDFCYEYVERYATDPTWVSPQTPLVQAFAAAVQEVVGHEPGYVYSPGSDDQRFVVQNAGIEQCIVYGPGEITQTHVIDESLAIDDLLTSIKVMALSAATLLGVESGANPYRQRH
ncbi:MAG: M20/M25/M40 family metallo-hydrolase [Chloroflexi bacterium]|nr:MAG: M20/M25/M40 family metallo-hydrolase [Chloroflexota bacterium]